MVVVDTRAHAMVDFSTMTPRPNPNKFKNRHYKVRHGSGTEGHYSAKGRKSEVRKIMAIVRKSKVQIPGWETDFLHSL